MRLIHFSDTHLGFSESSKADPATGVNVREQDVFSAFNTVIARAIELRPDLVIHSGDLFHSLRPSNRAIVTALVGFQRLSEARIPLLVVAGNHSVPRVATTASLFEALRVLPGVSCAHRARYEMFDVGDAAVHCIPHIPTPEVLRAALLEIRPNARKRFNVLVMHGAVQGTGEEYSLAEFNEVILPKSVFSRCATFDYIALGHFHKHQQVGPNAWYAGSTERFSIREAGYEKGFVEVDLATRKVVLHPIPTRDIIVVPPIPCRGRGFSAIATTLDLALGQAGPVEGKIVVLRLEDVDPTTWTELQRQRRELARQHAAGALEVRWMPSFAEPQGSAARSAPIGSLPLEFAAFMRTAKVEGLNRQRLRKLGERLISDALEESAE